MREIPSKCGSCGALFPCLPGVSSIAAEWWSRHCCERSRAAALSRQSRRSNALLLCIVCDRIKERGRRSARESRDDVLAPNVLKNLDDDNVDKRRFYYTCYFDFVKHEKEPCWRILGKNSMRLLENCEITNIQNLPPSFLCYFLFFLNK